MQNSKSTSLFGFFRKNKKCKTEPLGPVDPPVFPILTGFSSIFRFVKRFCARVVFRFVRTGMGSASRLGRLNWPVWSRFYFHGKNNPWSSLIKIPMRVLFSTSKKSHIHNTFDIFYWWHLPWTRGTVNFGPARQTCSLAWLIILDWAFWTQIRPNPTPVQAYWIVLDLQNSTHLVLSLIYIKLNTDTCTKGSITFQMSIFFSKTYRTLISQLSLLV